LSAMKKFELHVIATRSSLLFQLFSYGCLCFGS
jgi:hypothetical protein